MADLNPTPWSFQPWDVKLCGDVILDENEQRRWARAIFLGGLPYMWRKAEVIRNMIYDHMELRPGDKVLLIGESIEPCGFVDDVRERIGPEGEIRVVEILEEARHAYFTRRIGAGGQLATWRFDYTGDVPDGYFDSVACLQGVQHTDSWDATGTELLRITRPGGHIALGEIVLGGHEYMSKIRSDMHIEYLFEKLFMRIGWDLEEAPFYSTEELLRAFEGKVEDPHVFEWKGIEVFWGRKPAAN
ncbi:MAG: methyltransferase domain-containing protein [Chloroflexi bacterium]|nr:methyltransferase domain-containing protein [Chloroflexota bacterium]